MNRFSKILPSILLCCVALSACKEGEETNIAFNASIEPELTIMKEIRTRKTETYFDNGEQVGFLLLDLGGNLYNNSTGYEKYTYQNRRWECSNPTILNDDEARVYAFYPWSTSLDYARNGVQATIETVTQTDYLVGKQVNGSFINSQNPKSRLNMSHVLAKIQFSITKGGYAGDGKLTSAQFQCSQGSLLGTGYKVNVTTGNVTASGAQLDSNPHNIGTWGRDGIILSSTPTGTAGTQFMLMPGNGKIKIDLTIDNIDYSVICNLDGSLSSNGVPRTLVSGSVYTVNLRMSGQSLDIVSDNMILHNWFDGGSISTH